MSRLYRLRFLSWFLIPILVLVLSNIAAIAQAPAPRPALDQTVECEILVAGGGLAGTAAAYEALLAGRTVCLTEITDWVGGQISAQGTSALDEAKRQRQELFYSRGYKELRQRIEKKYKTLNPGDCWVSASCFLPKDAHAILWKELQEAEEKGEGHLKWFPSTVIKDLQITANGKQIRGAIAIQHTPAPNAPALNSEFLSQVIEDAYRYEDSDRFSKKVIRFVPLQSQAAPKPKAANWVVIDATETGELVALADVPYRLGIDPLSYLNPSSPSATGDPYCTQGFTYTFAMEQTQEPQPQPMPSFYPQYEPYYSYEKARPDQNYFDYVFTYRRIWSPKPRSPQKAFGVSQPKPGDISMQNWTWGNDYRPGTAADNLIYTRDQLEQRGELAPGGWMGGLRTETLRKGEENALGFYHWLVTGTTDSQLGEGVKQPAPNHRFLSGLDAPMGTAHGLSKYPYIREGRRIVGRPAFGYDDGFGISEIDISKVDYLDPYYQTALPARMYQALWTALAAHPAEVLIKNTPSDQILRRTRSRIYPDAIGISQYAIDFHPCMTLSPPEAPGNTEREGVRQSHGPAYPAEIPLRAMIPQKIDNLLVTGKSIATSFIAAAAYRVHSFEWSAGAGAGTTAAFALAEDVFPYQLVDQLPNPEPLLQKLQAQLVAQDNPIAFPDTSIFNLDWEGW
jgi:FAD dependent oxidoreductase